VTTLIVTNDFPPRIGGIESFVAAACTFLDQDVVVLTSTAPEAQQVDRAAAYDIVRRPGPLLPIPSVRREAVRLLRTSGATRVLFGAAAPLALLAPSLRVAGAKRIVALTHGHETWWAKLPLTRQWLRRIGEDVDALSTISDFTAAQIAPALSPAARTKLFRLSPPVDLGMFRPAETRRDPPGTRRCIAVGRFVPRKGFDTLLRSWRLVLDTWTPGSPWPELVLVGDGPLRAQLERMAVRLGIDDAVRFTGALPPAGVAAALQQADVFALPVRTRRLGLEPEGLGLAALEAAACRLPVVIGNSGGAPETVVDGRTGFVVQPRNPAAIAERLTVLLRDPDRAAAMGGAGRTYVAEHFAASAACRQLRAALRVDSRPIRWAGA
jgi:phosphatidyl-myo-inositol dimannoside synthase